MFPDFISCFYYKIWYAPLPRKLEGIPNNTIKIILTRKATLKAKHMHRKVNPF